MKYTVQETQSLSLEIAPNYLDEDRQKIQVISVK